MFLSLRTILRSGEWVHVINSLFIWASVTRTIGIARAAIPCLREMVGGQNGVEGGKKLTLSPLACLENLLSEYARKQGVLS